MVAPRTQEVDVPEAPRGQAASTSGLARTSLGLLLLGYLFIDVAAGAPGSPLVPPLPPGVAVPAWTVHVSRWAHLDRMGRTGLTVLCITVMAGLVGAFALVVREAWLGRVRVGIVLVAAGVILALSVTAPVLLSRDVYSYADYGRIFTLYHANPYVTVPSAFPADPFVRVSSAEWVHTRMLYGPVFGLISAGVVKVGRSATATILLFKLMAGVGIGLASILTAVACWRVRPERVALGAAVVGLNPVLVVHTVGGGHNDALIAALLAGALVAGVGRFRRGHEPGTDLQAERRGGLLDARSLLVTALLTLAVLIKAVVAPALLLWMWSLLRAAPRQNRARIGLAHVAVVAILVVALFAPFYAGWRTITPLGTLAGVQGWASGARLVGRGAQALVQLVAGSAAGRAAGKAVVGAFLLGFIVLFMRLARRATSERPADQWGVSLLLFALSAPYLVPWYVCWFIPFLALLTDEVLILVGLAAAALLAMTGIPADPAGGPGLWMNMMLGVHYGAAPIMLALFVVAAARTVRAREGRWPPPGLRKPGRTPGVPPAREGSGRST